MIYNRAKLTGQIIGAIRKGRAITWEKISPYTHQARALVGTGSTGPHDPILVRMGRRLEGQRDVTLDDNFFIGTKADGLHQLRERALKGSKVANNPIPGAISIFDAPGLLSPIRVEHGMSALSFSQFAYGIFGCPGPFSLLDPLPTKGLLEGLSFFGTPDDDQVNTIDRSISRILAMPNGKVLVVKILLTTPQLMESYYYGTPEKLERMKTTKPLRDDPHGGPFVFYIETADGRFMRFHEESYGWAFLGEGAGPSQVPLHEFLETHKLVFPEE